MVGAIGFGTLLLLLLFLLLNLRALHGMNVLL